MTYFFEDSIAEEYGNHKNWTRGCYITPDGKIFDVDEYAQTAHEGGFVIPYFNSFMHPEDEEEFRYYTKEKLLQTLINWEKILCKKEFDVNKKEQQMRLALTRYLINMYRSSRSIFDKTSQTIDFSTVTGIPKAMKIYMAEIVSLRIF